MEIIQYNIMTRHVSVLFNPVTPSFLLFIEFQDNFSMHKCVRKLWLSWQLEIAGSTISSKLYNVNLGTRPDRIDSFFIG